MQFHLRVLVATLVVLTTLITEKQAYQIDDLHYVVSSGDGSFAKYYSSAQGSVVTLNVRLDEYHQRRPTSPTIDMNAVGPWQGQDCTVRGLAMATDYIFVGLGCNHSLWFTMVECIQMDGWGDCSAIGIIDSSATSFDGELSSAPHFPFFISSDGAQMVSQQSNNSIGVWRVSNDTGFVHQATLYTDEAPIVSLTNKYDAIVALVITSTPAAGGQTEYNSLLYMWKSTIDNTTFERCPLLNAGSSFTSGYVLAMRNHSCMVLQSYTPTDPFEFSSPLVGKSQTCNADMTWSATITVQFPSDPNATFDTIPCDKVAFGALYSSTQYKEIIQSDVDDLKSMDCMIGAASGRIQVVSPRNHAWHTEYIGSVYPTSDFVCSGPVGLPCSLPYRAMSSPALFIIASPQFQATSHDQPRHLRTISSQNPGSQTCYKMSQGCEEVTLDMYYVKNCPRGLYNPVSGLTPCLPCPSGTFTNAEQSISCAPCPSGTLCPVGSVEPITMEGAADLHNSVYPFPLRAEEGPATLSAQGLIVSGLFSAPRGTVGPLFFGLTIGLLGALAFLGLVMCLVSMKRPSAPLIKLLRRADFFKYVQYHDDNDTYSIYTSPVGSILLLVLITVFVLSVAFIVQLSLDYKPLLLSDQSRGGNSQQQEPPQNSIRSTNLFATNSFPPSSINPQLLQDLKSHTYVTAFVTLGDYACSLSDNQVGFTPFIGCMDQNQNVCPVDVILVACAKNLTQLPIETAILPPHEFGATVQASVGSSLKPVGWVNVTLVISDARSDNETQVGKIVGSRVERHIMLPDSNINNGEMLLGVYEVPISMSYVIRQSEALNYGESPVTEGYVALTLGKAHITSHSTWLHYVSLPESASAVTIKLRLIQESVWSFERELRIVHWPDAVVAVVLMGIAAYNAVSFIAAVEKRILSKIQRSKENTYQEIEDASVNM